MADITVTLTPSTPSSGVLTCDFAYLQEVVGRKFFGLRLGFSATQLSDINDIIRQGLHAVYIAHNWSFFHPLYTIATVAEQEEYDVPAAYDTIEGAFTYDAEEADWYPPVRIVEESEIRKRRQDYDESDRPIIAAIVTKAFDATAGSQRKIVFYPTPDAVYNLTAKVHLRPTMPTEASPYLVGGEVLAQVLVEACLAAGERILDERMGVHSQQFQAMLAAAIIADKDKSSPNYLGPDKPDDGCRDDTRVVRLGDVSINGVVQ